MKSTKNTIAFIVCLLFSVLGVYSQEASKKDSIIDASLDQLFFEKEADLYELFDGNTKYHFLYFGSMLNTGTSYAGREFIDPVSEQSILNASAQLYYFISNGLYFGASGAWYDKIDPGFRTAVVSLGYTTQLKKLEFLRYRISYDRFIYLNMGPDYEPTFNSDMNAGISLKYKNFGTRFDYTLMMGSDSVDHQLSLDFYARFKLFDLGKYDRIQFKPEISTFFSNEVVEYITNPEEANTTFGEPIYAYKREFGLLNTQLIMPLSISYKNIEFEASFIYNFPRTYDPLYYFENNYYFRFSLGYILQIK